MDVWGPYSIQSITGAKYFLTVVDDFSRAVWTFLMHNKTQVTKLNENFLMYAKTQFELTVKKIRIDNGGEFISAEC